MADPASALRIEERADGAVLAVRAAPGASRERIVGVHGDALKIAVSAPPEKGKANERIAAVLATALGIAARDVELFSGATSRDKRFLVRAVGAAELRTRIGRHIGS